MSLMKTPLLLFMFLSFVFQGNGQCVLFQADTMTIPSTGQKVTGQYVETTLKNQSEVRLFKTEEGRIFLRLIITENFYFNQVSTLEIRSGTKSYWVKNAKQYKVDKTHGLFITEIFSNYVATLRAIGITGIEFGAYTDFAKSDVEQIKEMAGCMYESLGKKK